MAKPTKQLFDKAKGILSEIESAEVKDKDALEKFRIQYLGSKGIIKKFFSSIKEVDPSDRKAYGQLVNDIKAKAEAKHQSSLQQPETGSSRSEDIDLSLPAEPHPLGSRHPIAIMNKKIIDIFKRIGFIVEEGPEIENDWYNFTALNIPKDHPARDMQDTFFIQRNPDILLRTHTSNTQIRVMENSKPPIRIICPGRVYRNETVDAGHHTTFHQIEGLYVDENVSFADLKQTLYFFAQKIFGKETKMRLRPSYFPFTEPSAEMDIICLICKGKGCSVCKQTGWVEILGCGMVDPAVLDNCKIDSNKYTGYAFGLGIERIVMLKYRINDIRLFFENDIRFLKQFKSAF